MTNCWPEPIILGLSWNCCFLEREVGVKVRRQNYSACLPVDFKANSKNKKRTNISISLFKVSVLLITKTKKSANHK
jgi:hypothetical protein